MNVDVHSFRCYRGDVYHCLDRGSCCGSDDLRILYRPGVEVIQNVVRGSFMLFRALFTYSILSLQSVQFSGIS